MDYNFVIDVRGDKRYEYLAKRLADLGYDVFLYENFIGVDANVGHRLMSSGGLSADGEGKFIDVDGGEKFVGGGKFIGTEANVRHRLPSSDGLSMDGEGKFIGANGGEKFLGGGKFIGTETNVRHRLSSSGGLSMDGEGKFIGANGGEKFLGDGKFIGANGEEKFVDGGKFIGAEKFIGSKPIGAEKFVGEEKLNGADANVVCILPPSVRLSADEAEKLIDGSTLFAFTQKAAADVLLKKRIKLINIFAEESFAYKNAMITADGALMLVAENTDIVFFDMKILVIGFGRVGKSVAKIFKTLSSAVDVLTFDRGEYASAVLFSDGRYCSFEDVKFDIYDVVINTVPAQLVNKHVIARFKEGVFLLELASEPGGFDKEAVKRSGIRFLRASGVPAKVAPVSAGKILLEEIAGRLGIKY